MTLTVFTTVLGDTDPLRRPTQVAADVRYVCLCDRPQRVPPYEDVLVPRPVDPRLTSRALKILATHPALGDPAYSLWHDAAFRLTCDPRVLLARLGDADLLALKHPHRDRIEDEAEAIVQCGYAPRDVLTRQMAHYRRAGFCDQAAITSTGLCLRRHTPAVLAFNQLWWAEVARWCWRDQMSVDYALWQAGLRVRYLAGHYRENPYARWTLRRPAPEAA